MRVIKNVFIVHDNNEDIEEASGPKLTVSYWYEIALLSNLPPLLGIEQSSPELSDARRCSSRWQPRLWPNF